MLGMPGILVGIAGTAFLAASFAQTAMGDSVMPKAPSAVFGLTASQNIARQTKADRLAPPAAAGARAAVTTVELIGVARATVILRDREGNEIYRSDPLTNTTYFSKDTDLPIVTIKEEAQSPVVQQSIQPTREQNGVPERTKRKASPIGCVGSLSPLVKSEAGRTPSLCLASTEQNPGS